MPTISFLVYLNRAFNFKLLFYTNYYHLHTWIAILAALFRAKVTAAQRPLAFFITGYGFRVFVAFNLKAMTATSFFINLKLKLFTTYINDEEDTILYLFCAEITFLPAHFLAGVVLAAVFVQ